MKSDGIHKNYDQDCHASACARLIFLLCSHKALINWCHLQCYLNGPQSTMVMVCVLFNSPSSTHCSCALHDKFDFLSHTIFCIFFISFRLNKLELKLMMLQCLKIYIWNSWNNNFLLSRGDEKIQFGCQWDFLRWNGRLLIFLVTIDSAKLSTELKIF